MHAESPSYATTEDIAMMARDTHLERFVCFLDRCVDISRIGQGDLACARRALIYQDALISGLSRQNTMNREIALQHQHHPSHAPMTSPSRGQTTSMYLPATGATNSPPTKLFAMVIFAAAALTGSGHMLQPHEL